MIRAYFAYGSNMNPARMRSRGVDFVHAEGAVLPGFGLVFDKRAGNRHDAGHANIRWAPGQRVHGVLYWLAEPGHIARMDVFERAPINYSREVFLLQTAAAPAAARPLDAATAGAVPAWVYVANRGAIREGLRPEPDYLAHLLAGEAFLPADYVEALRATECLRTHG